MTLKRINLRRRTRSRIAGDDRGAHSPDLPNCATSPAARLSWTIREIVNIIHRRS
jgi:hypothetical protein